MLDDSATAPPVLDCGTMKTLRTYVVVVLFALLPLASAQLLADVLLSTAIMSDLMPGVRLPSGSFRAQGPGSERFVASLPDATSFDSWEVYTATGILANLQDAFVRDVANGFAVAGLFQSARAERAIGSHTYTRYLFSDGEREAVLWVVAAERSVTWAIGTKGTRP